MDYRCLLAWVVMVVGCGPTVGGDGPGGADGTGTGDASSSETSETSEGSSSSSSSGDELCLDVTNEDPGARVDVTIRNDRAEPIYLVEQYYCFPSFLRVLDPAGEEIDWLTDGWYIECDQLASESPLCGGPACAVQTVRIDPGGEYVDEWRGIVYERNELTPECSLADDITTCGPQCFIERAPLPGMWSFDVQAGSEIDCGDIECECEGEPENGSCLIYTDASQQGPLDNRSAVIDYPNETTALVVFD